MGDNVAADRPCYIWGIKVDVDQDTEWMKCQLAPLMSCDEDAPDLYVFPPKTIGLLWSRKTAADWAQPKEGLQDIWLVPFKYVPII